MFNHDVYENLNTIHCKYLKYLQGYLAKRSSTHIKKENKYSTVISKIKKSKLKHKMHCDAKMYFIAVGLELLIYELVAEFTF